MDARIKTDLLLMAIVMLLALCSVLLVFNGTTESPESKFTFWTPPAVEPTHYVNSPNITWVSDPVAVKERFDEYEAEHGVKVRGLAVWNTQHCTIYAHEPETVNDQKMMTLGHEFYHCVRGSYHD